MVFALMGLLNLLASTPPANTAEATFPQSFQGTWATKTESCEAELTNGIVIRPNTVSYYDGPERLTKVDGAITWKSDKGRAVTYLMTFVTATSPGMGRDSDRGKPYRRKYTMIGDHLYVTDAKVAAWAVDHRQSLCPLPKKELQLTTMPFESFSGAISGMSALDPLRTFRFPPIADIETR